MIITGFKELKDSCQREIRIKCSAQLLVISDESNCMIAGLGEDLHSLDQKLSLLQNTTRMPDHANLLPSIIEALLVEAAEIGDNSANRSLCADEDPLAIP